MAYLNLFFVEGHRFHGEVIEIIHAQSGLDCILQCVFQDKSCRSVNFRKISFINETENCQLLYRIHSEKPQLLYKDERFDYLILLQPERVSNNFSIYLLRIVLLFYCKCCNLIGYSICYLFLDTQQVTKTIITFNYVFFNQCIFSIQSHIVVFFVIKMASKYFFNLKLYYNN